MIIDLFQLSKRFLVKSNHWNATMLKLLDIIDIYYGSHQQIKKISIICSCVHKILVHTKKKV